jgi:hypothetical protein
VFKVWYESQSIDVQGKFLGRLCSLGALPPEEWKLPLFRSLHGEASGLGEIRFMADRVQQRPLGFRGPSGDVFTLLYPAKEQSDRFIPRNACGIALSRKAEVEKNANSRSKPCWLFVDPADDLPARIDERPEA